MRTPLIPGMTARVENIQAIGQFLSRVAGGSVSRWDLLAFNNLCKDKYARLDMAWEFSDAKLLDQVELDALGEAARQSGVNPLIVQVSGSTRTEIDGLESSRQPNVMCGC